MRKIFVILGAILGFGLLPMLMGPTGGLPANPQFSSVKIKQNAAQYGLLTINGTSAGKSAGIELQTNGTSKGYLYTVGTAGDILVGSAVDDFVFRCPACTQRWSFDNGATSAMTASNSFFQYSPADSNFLLNSTTSTNDTRIQFQRAGTLQAYIAAIGTANDIATGSTVGDLVIRTATAGKHVLVSNDNGTTQTLIPRVYSFDFAASVGPSVTGSINLAGIGVTRTSAGIFPVTWTAVPAFASSNAQVVCTFRNSPGAGVTTIYTTGLSTSGVTVNINNSAGSFVDANAVACIIVTS